MIQAADPLISCICVTRNRVALLRRAVNCFFEQTWPNSELLIVYESDDEPTRSFVAGLSDERVRGIEVPISPKKTLGALRNLAIDKADGRYICQWDDDDWYDRERLSVQYAALRSSGRPACVLSRWLCVDAESRRAYLAPHRPWEGSLLVERDRMVRYPELVRGEDTPAVEELARRQELHMLDRPDLYVYTFHTRNTWDRAHWSQLMGMSTALPWDEATAILEKSQASAIVTGALPLREYLEPTRYWFAEASKRCSDPVDVSYYRFGGAPVRMRVAGAALANHLKTTFDNLRADDVDPNGHFALRIDAWDRVTTGTGCPGVPFPPDRNELLDEGLITFYQHDRIIRYERGHYCNIIDRPANHILTWREDGQRQALYERAKPFPNMLEVWYRDQGIQQLHAGLVSHEGKGVLFIGQSGSGKSTCTISCALDGFDYLGDDHNGLQMTRDGRCIGHSYYNAARIGPTHLEHFPELREHEVKPFNAYDHKSLVWMTRVRPGHVARSCQIAAVIMPRIVKDGPTRFRRASKVQTLLALAPSTLKVPMGAGLGGFMNLTEFIPRMPCFVLECGPDVRQIPACVHQILEQATT